MRILLPICIALLSACSSGSDPAATPVEDTGAGDTAAPIAKNFGFVSVQRQKGPDKTSVAINAAFFDAPAAVCPTVVNAGSCQYVRCPSGASVVGNARDAGVVSVVHGSDAPIELVKSSGYAKSDLVATLFSEGDTFTFSASGADVPAFSDAKVVAPGDLTTTPFSGIVRSRDFTINWTGGKTGDVRFFVYGSLERESGKESESISCSAPAAGGTLTVPKELLAKIVSTSGSIALTPTMEQTVESGGWSVHLTVEALGAVGLVSFL